MKCEICGTPKEDDLFSEVTDSKACSICTVSFIGGLPQTDELIKNIRERLNLKDGEYLSYDRAKTASQILGR